MGRLIELELALDRFGNQIVSPQAWTALRSIGFELPCLRVALPRWGNVSAPGRIAVRVLDGAVLIHVASRSAVWRTPHADAFAHAFCLVLHLGGDPCYMGQSARRCRVTTGDVCLLDAAAPFQVEPTGRYEHLVLQLPRSRILASHPHLLQNTARTLDCAWPATRMLAGALQQLRAAAASLDAAAAQTAVDHVCRLLGALPWPGRPAARRLDAALRCIESRLGDPALTAGDVAAQQGIGRRRLDQQCVAVLGAPVAACISELRLSRAAQALLDPEQSHRAVNDIAREFGYPLAAPFTRAFRRRFGCTPSCWRQGGGSQDG